MNTDAAFALLRRWSSHTNIKLRDVSKLEVDATALSPDGAEPAHRPDRHRIDLDELIRSQGTAGSRRWTSRARSGSSDG